MTNQSIPTDALASQLIAALDADDFDLLDALTALRALLTDDDFAALALACDICPTHICDTAICLDDETHDPYATS